MQSSMRFEVSVCSLIAMAVRTRFCNRAALQSPYAASSGRGAATQSKVFLAASGICTSQISASTLNTFVFSHRHKRPCAWVHLSLCVQMRLELADMQPRSNSTHDQAPSTWIPSLLPLPSES